MKNLTLLFLLLLVVFRLEARQNNPISNGKIEGIILDSLTRNPVEYATIAVYQAGGERIVTGTTSDIKGKFSVGNIAAGNYRVVIDFIGYSKKVLSPVKIDGRSTLSLGTLLLSASVTTLKDVTITAQKNIIENKIDKLIYNAENDITSQTGIAIDVLKKVPQVTVDINGNVELQGNSNIRFLIDGKPSTVFGNSITDVLQTIPASRIQSIEVVTSPGAKYDAEGTGGIINIILKKTTVKGISGNTSLSAGTRLENGSVNLNARTGHIGVTAYLSGNAQMPSTTLNSLDRLSADSLSHQHMNQDGSSKFKRYGYQGGLGFDWNPAATDNITASLNYSYFGNNSNSTTSQQTLVYDLSGNQVSDMANVLKSVSDNHGQTYDWSLGYRHNFNRKGHDLNFLYTSSYSKNYSSYQQSQNLVTPDSITSGSQGYNPGTNRETDLSIDYSLPIGASVNIETGVKAVLYELCSNNDTYTFTPAFNEFLPDKTQSYTLTYDRNIYAGYLSAAFTLFHWLDIKAGGRYEYTGTRIVYTNNPNVDTPGYKTIIPSLVLSHTFKNRDNIRFSYSFRIQRPDYRDLNPFINLSDPHNITTGNPDLKPELVNGFEAAYNKSFHKGGNISFVAFYRRNTDDIQSFVTYYPSYKIGDSLYSDVTVTSRANISLEQRGGINLYGSVTALKGLSIRSNLSGFYRYISNTNGGTGSMNSFEYRINLNLSYQFPWNLAVEFFGNFNSPRITVQGKVPSFTTYNFAVRKQFFGKKASVALTAVNPFNKYVDQKTEMSGENFILNSLRQVPYRSFGINLTYKFGKLQFRPEREEEHNDVSSPQGL